MSVSLCCTYIRVLCTRTATVLVTLITLPISELAAMGAILSYFFPESDPITFERVLEDKEDKVTKEVSSAREETEQANPQENYLVTDLADEKEYELVEEASDLPATEIEEGFEVVQDNKLDIVHNIVSVGTDDLNDSFVAMEASPKALNIESICSIQDSILANTSLCDSGPAEGQISKSLIPEADISSIANPIICPTPEPTKAPVLESNKMSIEPMIDVSQGPAKDDDLTLEPTIKLKCDIPTAGAEQEIESIGSVEVVDDKNVVGAGNVGTDNVKESSDYESDD